MYLHIGKGNMIDERGIVGIFDLDNTTQSHITRKYLAMAEKRGEVVNAAEEELPKSFILYNDARQNTVYLSQMAAATLLKRSIEEQMPVINGGKHGRR